MKLYNFLSIVFFGVFSFCSALCSTPLDLQPYIVPDLSAYPFSVGLDEDSLMPYVGGRGLLSAIEAARASGASSLSPVAVFIQPGTYVVSNFSIPDGVDLIGIMLEKTSSDARDVSIQVDYVSICDAVVNIQNISFSPLNFSHSALNLMDSTASFLNCSLGNLNGSSGNCIMNCQDSFLEMPGATTAATIFNFTGCTLSSGLYSSGAPVEVVIIGSTIEDNFSIDCGSVLDISVFNSNCSSIHYSNEGSLEINFNASTINGRITKTGGIDANIFYESIR